MASKDTRNDLSEPARPRARFSCGLERAAAAPRTRPRAGTPRLALMFDTHHDPMMPLTHA